MVSFERMRRIQVDEENMVAVVQPGATLAELDAVTAGHSPVYPVFPGEHSASIGGNIATNAGGSRAVRYGVTRHNVLGLEMVLASGTVLRSGGKFVKVSSGYDLTQLVIGSEGTLALVTEATLRLYPRLPYQSTVLAPFSGLAHLMRAVPELVRSGIGMTTLEYIDAPTMESLRGEFGLKIGVSAAVRGRTRAYLVMVMEGRQAQSLEAEVQDLAALVAGLGAIEAYVLPGGRGPGAHRGQGEMLLARQAVGRPRHPRHRGAEGVDLRLHDGRAPDREGLVGLRGRLRPRRRRQHPPGHPQAGPG